MSKIMNIIIVVGFIVSAIIFCYILVAGMSNNPSGSELENRLHESICQNITISDKYSKDGDGLIGGLAKSRFIVDDKNHTYMYWDENTDGWYDITRGGNYSVHIYDTLFSLCDKY